MKITNTLANAIDAIDAPPCVDCIMLPRCAALRLACDDFRHYVNPTLNRVGERNRVANRKLFLEIYEREDNNVTITRRKTPRSKPTNRDTSTHTSVGRWDRYAVTRHERSAAGIDGGEGASGAHVLDQRGDRSITLGSVGTSNRSKSSPHPWRDHRKSD